MPATCPWRRTRDPYAIWVSEVMLQQTQVATVIPYFERFLSAFPTLADLAAADEQDVLRLWEGLGYYRRARDLHRAARQLAADHAGRLPDDPDAAPRACPASAATRANAVLSQAFDRRLPILEANSLRVLCRLLGVRDDPQQTAVQARLWHAAEDLLPTKRAGDIQSGAHGIGGAGLHADPDAVRALPAARPVSGAAGGPSGDDSGAGQAGTGGAGR